MIRTPRVYDQWTLLQRIIRRMCSYRFCKQYSFFFTGLTILIFGFTVAGFSPCQYMFPLAMTLIATVTVFLMVLIAVEFDVRHRESEELTPQQEESWNYRIQCIDV